MIAQLWSMLQANDNFVYLVVGGGEMPVLEPPDDLETTEVPEGYDPDLSEATLNTFVTLEGAEDFRRYLIEVEEIRPSSVKTIKLSLKDLFSLVDELAAIAIQEYGSGLKIDLLHVKPEMELIAHDTIFSSRSDYN